MRLLIFEFITGGGFIDDILPHSLMQEGAMMRTALLQDLIEISGLTLLVLNDIRINAPQISTVNTINIKQGSNLELYLRAINGSYDTVWLIAPETNGILVKWQQFFSQENKQICLSKHKALILCQNKLETIKHLQKLNIKCVASEKYPPHLVQDSGKWVLKLIDSVSCEQVYLIQSRQQWHDIDKVLNKQKKYLIQPYIKGVVLSLSALFYQGKSAFICCNQQHLTLKKNQFQLNSCTVNVKHENELTYQALCTNIAQAIPGLWGYIGIDLIETEEGELVILEINPRLTTSYVGIKEATGINVAAQVLNLLNNKIPNVKKIKSQAISVNLH
jgi:predicted ATP-grasp superfamily ATP-dependent carboligase